MKNLFSLLFIVIISSCSNTKNTTSKSSNHRGNFEITEISTDETYGFNPKNAVKVGGISSNSGPLNEVKYLNMLSGPNGEKISFYRAGSCCGIKSENAPMGYAILDNYRVTWEGSKDTVSIYINMYDKGVLKAPFGFTIKKE